METLADKHKPHPHLAERHKDEPRHAGKVHRASMSTQDKIAKFICDWVGTMYAAYLFTLIAFIALPQAIESHSTTVLINWFSGNWMQFVLLPIIMVAGNLASRLINHFIEESYKNSVLIYKDNKVMLEVQDDMHLLLKKNTDLTQYLHDNEKIRVGWDHVTAVFIAELDKHYTVKKRATKKRA